MIGVFRKYLKNLKPVKFLEWFRRAKSINSIGYYGTNHATNKRMRAIAVIGLIALAIAPAMADVQTAQAIDHKLTRLASARAQQAARRDYQAVGYAQQLATVDQLKRQRASWRRDRALREALAASHATAKQLDSVTQSLVATDRELDEARILLSQHIMTNERAASPQEAAAYRALAAKWLRTDQHRISAPDLEIDPLADPEELDEQARRLAATEAQLRVQLASLDAALLRDARRVTLRSEHAQFGTQLARDEGMPSSRRTTDGARAPAAEDPMNGADAALGEGGGLPTSSPEDSALNNDAIDMAATAYALGGILDVSVTQPLLGAADAPSRTKAATTARAQLAAKVAKIAYARKTAIERARMLRQK